MLRVNIEKPILITINGKCYDQIKKPRFSIRYLGLFCFYGGISFLLSQSGDFLQADNLFQTRQFFRNQGEITKP